MDTDWRVQIEAIMLQLLDPAGYEIPANGKSSVKRLTCGLDGSIRFKWTLPKPPVRITVATSFIRKWYFGSMHNSPVTANPLGYIANCCYWGGTGAIQPHCR